MDQVLSASPLGVVMVCMGINFLDQAAFIRALLLMAVTKLDVFWFKLLVEHNVAVTVAGLATIAGSLVTEARLLMVVFKGYKA